MITVGIDVGVTGALASLDEQGNVVHLADLPVTAHGKQKWITGGALLTTLFAARRGSEPARVFVEYLHALPMMAGEGDAGGKTRGGGIWAASAKGMVLGSVLAVIQIAELPFELVVPQKWKRALNLMMPKASYAEKKQASLDRARMLFPKASLARQKDHGRAEALLIAHWAQRHVLGIAASETAAVAAAQAGELDLVGGGAP